ncbi:hypothetical protein BC834DRAFT_901441 [Gloeopeniophorella convolvens]|nr:hypothetical protein BC834DRAFT_901441 [Gloeopeniophorella convolvens]
MDASHRDEISAKKESDFSGPATYANSLSTTAHGSMDKAYTPLDYRPEPARRRFGRAFLVAALVLIVADCLITATILSGYRTWFTIDSDPSTLIDDRIVECTDWTSTSNKNLPHVPGFITGPGSWANAEFDLPIDAKALYVVSRGSLASGIVRVGQSAEVEDLKVNVSVHYRDSEALSRARVCQVERGDRGSGVAILTPFRWIPPGRKDTLQFVVDVTFPSPKDGTQHLPAFAADVPSFGLRVGDLSSLNFDLFALKATNNHISAKSIVGDVVVVDARNSNIEGAFNVTKSLVLATSNGHIKALVNAENGVPTEPTKVSLKTSNGFLASKISLFTNASSGTGGAFRVGTHTRNAPLAVKVNTSPPDSRLVLDASSKNAAARVALPPAFEGDLLLVTTQHYPSIREIPGVEDPSGHERTRNITSRGIFGRIVVGNVSWVPQESELAGAGKAGVSVVTSNAPVTLAL